MRTSFLGWLLLALAAGHSCAAHGFAGSGLLHPLTGLDHALAMGAVGAWSAQLGGRAIYAVPACFVLFMVAGGIAGIGAAELRQVESLIALSVCLLGAAIAAAQRLAILPAGMAVGLFGFCHGFAHAAETPPAAGRVSFVVGFLLTTAGLHLVGAVGGLLLLENKHGQTTLRLLGGLTAIAGFYLLLSHF